MVDCPRCSPNQPAYTIDSRRGDPCLLCLGYPNSLNAGLLSDRRWGVHPVIAAAWKFAGVRGVADLAASADFGEDRELRGRLLAWCVRRTDRQIQGLLLTREATEQRADVEYVRAALQ